MHQRVHQWSLTVRLTCTNVCTNFNVHASAPSTSAPPKSLCVQDALQPNITATKAAITKGETLQRGPDTICDPNKNTHTCTYTSQGTPMAAVPDCQIELCCPDCTSDEDAIAKLPDPEPLRPLSKEADDDFDDDIEPEDIPDPDPIPGVFAEDDDIGDTEKGGGIKRLIAPAIIIVAIGAIVAGLIVGRPYVVALWPAANDYVYDLLGLHVAVPGDGLERKITRTAVETVANVDHVIATGFVTNVSDKEQPIPEVLVQLLDAKIQVLDTKTVKLEKTSLQPGETLQFKAVFEGAPATARTVRVEWGKFIEAAAQ